MLGRLAVEPIGHIELCDQRLRHRLRSSLARRSLVAHRVISLRWRISEAIGAKRTSGKRPAGYRFDDDDLGENLGAQNSRLRSLSSFTPPPIPVILFHD